MLCATSLTTLWYAPPPLPLLTVLIHSQKHCRVKQRHAAESQYPLGAGDSQAGGAGVGSADEPREVVLLVTGIDDTQKTHLEQWAQALQGLVVTKCSDAGMGQWPRPRALRQFSHLPFYTPSVVTHIVTSANREGLAKRTIKYLWGLLAGKRLVSLDCMRRIHRLGTGCRCVLE